MPNYPFRSSLHVIPVQGKITIFPAFYSVDRRSTISQVLAKVSNNFDRQGGGDYMNAEPYNVTQLSIYLIDSSDLPSIYALAKDMGVSFPRIEWLTLRFERRCEIVSILLSR